MKARSIHVRPNLRASNRRLVITVIASLALVSTACGEDDPDIDAAGVTVEDAPEDAEDDTSTAEPADGADGDEASTPVSEETDADAAATNGMNEHRPPPAGEPDCAAVTASPPGAIITFPSNNDPSWLEAGPGPVTVEVVGCSDSFEANIQYDAFHGQNTTPTLSGFTEGGTLGNWGEFSFEETYWTPGDWTVVIFVNDAESGNRVEYDEVTFTVS